MGAWLHFEGDHSESQIIRSLFQPSRAGDSMEAVTAAAAAPTAAAAQKSVLSARARLITIIIMIMPGRQSSKCSIVKKKKRRKKIAASLHTVVAFGFLHSVGIQLIGSIRMDCVTC